VQVSQGDDNEIPITRDDEEPDLVDACPVIADVNDANCIQDNDDEIDEDNVSEDDEESSSDRESDT